MNDYDEVAVNNGYLQQLMSINRADLYGQGNRMFTRDSYTPQDASNARALGGSNAYFCDRCNKPFVSNRGNSFPSITFTAPGSSTDSYSESLTLGVCSECYLLIRRACGIEDNQPFAEALAKRERDLSTQKALPRIIFDPEGEEFDKRLNERNTETPETKEE